jgi:phosphoribosylformimino-5-aminoimidazole carboxamide ribotide isomerase
LAALAVPLWLDAGVASVEQARGACDIGAARVVVGLETLPSYGVLQQICFVIGGERVVFSLDLRDGEPMVAPDVIAPCEPAHELAMRAADAGVGAVVVLDVARVGSGSGIDMALIERVRGAAPGVMLLAGGGVRDLDDLRRLAGAGCDGALVATALHSGRLSAADVAATRLF